MKRTIFATASLGLLAALAIPAIAQPGPPEEGGPRPFMDRMLEELDTDGDGTVSDAEKEAFKAAKFAEADANNDGGVSLEEARAFKEREREAFKAKREAEMFARMDTDGNGLISAEEFEAAPMGERMRKHKDGKRGGMRPSREEILKKFDTDGDGTLSEAERAKIREFHMGPAPTDQ